MLTRWTGFIYVFLDALIFLHPRLTVLCLVCLNRSASRRDYGEGCIRGRKPASGDIPASPPGHTTQSQPNPTARGFSSKRATRLILLYRSKSALIMQERDDQCNPALRNSSNWPKRNFLSTKSRCPSWVRISDITTISSVRR